MLSVLRVYPLTAFNFDFCFAWHQNYNRTVFFLLGYSLTQFVKILARKVSEWLK